MSLTRKHFQSATTEIRTYFNVDSHRNDLNNESGSARNKIRSIAFLRSALDSAEVMARFLNANSERFTKTQFLADCGLHGLNAYILEQQAVQLAIDSGESLDLVRFI